MSNVEIQARQVFFVPDERSGFVTFRLDNIVCDTCEMAFLVMCAGRACHCPVCGTRLEFPWHAKAPDEQCYEFEEVNDG